MFNDKRRRGYAVGLSIALALLALAALLGRAAETSAPVAKVVTFPRDMSARDWSRMRRRARIEPPVQGAPIGTSTPRDSLLAALPASFDRMALVIEANALVNSPVGGLILDCLSAALPEMTQGFARAGVDIRTQLDRIALVDDMMVVGGEFGAAHLERLVGEGQPEKHGVRGRLYGPREGGGDILGVWGDNIAVFGSSREQVVAALDKLEAPYKPEESPLSPLESYGDIFGVMSPSALGLLVGDGGSAGNSSLPGKLSELASKIKLHMDVAEDAALVVDVDGQGASQANDLAHAFGGAVAMARAQALTRGDQHLASVLEQARAVPDPSGRTRMELPVPSSILQDRLRACAQGRHANPALSARVPDGAGMVGVR